MIYIHYHDENQQNVLSPEGMVLKQVKYTWLSENQFSCKSMGMQSC